MDGFKGFIVAVLVFFGIVTVAVSTEIVDTGERGVRVRLGEVVGGALPEGLYFNTPFVTHIQTMDIKTQKVESTSNTFTKDVQQANIEAVLNYSLDGESVPNLYRTVGYAYEDKIIKPAVEGALKGVFGQFEAVDVVSNRQTVADKVGEALKIALAPRGIVVENFTLANIDFTDEFEQAVEAKVVAVQAAARAKNVTVQIQEEANQKIIAAKAEAESMRIRSEALQQNQNLIGYELATRWNGVLPTTMLGDSIPLLNLSEKK